MGKSYVWFVSGLMKGKDVQANARDYLAKHSKEAKKKGA